MLFVQWTLINDWHPLYLPFVYYFGFQNFTKMSHILCLISVHCSILNPKFLTRLATSAELTAASVEDQPDPNLDRDRISLLTLQSSGHQSEMNLV